MSESAAKLFVGIYPPPLFKAVTHLKIEGFRRKINDNKIKYFITKSGGGFNSRK